MFSLSYGSIHFSVLFQTADQSTLGKVLEIQPEKREAIMDEMKQILTPMAQKYEEMSDCLHA